MTPADYGLKYGEYFYEPNSGMTIIHAKGTDVKISKEYIEKCKVDGKGDIYDYASFSHLYNTDSEFSYVFYKRTDPNAILFFHNNSEEVKKFHNSEWSFKITPAELEFAIEEYVNDVAYDVTPPEFRCMKKDWEIPGMTGAWGILIAIMIATMVVKGFPILWLIEIAIFNSWRSDFINK